MAHKKEEASSLEGEDVPGDAVKKHIACYPAAEAERLHGQMIRKRK